MGEGSKEELWVGGDVGWWSVPASVTKKRRRARGEKSESRNAPVGSGVVCEHAHVDSICGCGVDLETVDAEALGGGDDEGRVSGKDLIHPGGAQVAGQAERAGGSRRSSFWGRSRGISFWGWTRGVLFWGGAACRTRGTSPAGRGVAGVRLRGCAVERGERVEPGVGRVARCPGQVGPEGMEGERECEQTEPLRGGSGRAQGRGKGAARDVGAAAPALSHPAPPAPLTRPTSWALHRKRMPHSTDGCASEMARRRSGSTESSTPQKPMQRNESGGAGGAAGSSPCARFCRLGAIGRGQRRR